MGHLRFPSPGTLTLHVGSSCLQSWILQCPAALKSRKGRCRTKVIPETRQQMPCLCNDGIPEENCRGSSSFKGPWKVRVGCTIFWECHVSGMLWNQIVDPCFQPGDIREHVAGLELGVSEVAVRLRLYCSRSLASWLYYLWRNWKVSWSDTLNICWENQIVVQKMVEGRISFRAQTFTFCLV